MANVHMRVDNLPVDGSSIQPGQKARLLYAAANSDLTRRLWNAALGKSDEDHERATGQIGGQANGLGLDALLSLFDDREAPASAPAARTADAPSAVAPAESLGGNARHQPALAAAAARTGIPETALAAIIDAEAAKGPGGSWLAYSRNPRSSAAGLGQFLSSSWISEAQRAGTWLNGFARAQGWLDSAGRVIGGARSDLLALRYDATASIEAVADYAQDNLARLKSAGIDIGTSVASIAQSAYLGHHLGIGDATRFLKGALDPSRAKLLLVAQLGLHDAGARIANAGSAVMAHRQWLLDYVGKRIDPSRFG